MINDADGQRRRSIARLGGGGRMAIGSAVRAWRSASIAVAAAALLGVGMLGGCGAIPQPTAEGRAAAPAVAAGPVLARNDRLLIYDPAPGETLQSIAESFLGSADRWWEIADLNGIRAITAGRAVVVPLKAFNPGGIEHDRYQTVPVLCYHRLGAGNGKMVVSVANFAAQLDWLARNDYRVVKLKDLRAFLDGKRPMPRRAVAITFDDGYGSFYRQAYPLLKKHGFPATVFVYTDFIGAGDSLTWPQMQEMLASGLVDVQAHSKSHSNLIQRQAGESDERYRERVEYEIRVPREIIRQKLQNAVTEYAYPYGDANELALDALARNSYQLAATVNPGGNAFFAQPFMLRRTMIYGDHDLDQFKAKLQVYREIDPR